MLVNKLYVPNKSKEAIIIDGISRKVRVIHKPKFYPDQIIHWSIMLILEEYFMKGMYHYSCASIKGRGVYYGAKYLKKILKCDKKNTKYCLKLDIKKYYPSIDKEILKSKFKRLFKDKDLLELLNIIIDSEENIPIGFYTSQWFANFYLTDLDHYIKEKLKIKYYIRYMDDFILIHHSKEYLEYCKNKINEKIIQLKLELNKKTQICEIHNGIVFLGYRFILKNKKLYTLISSKNKRNIKKKITKEPNKGIFLKERYFSYLKECKCNNFLYNICNLNVNPKRLTRYRKSGIILMNGGENMVKIRLKRMGTTKRPFYRIVVADSRSPRDGRSIEEIGTYNPVANPAEVKIDKELAIKWLKNGAEPTDTVRNLLSQNGILKEYHEMRMGK